MNFAELLEKQKSFVRAGKTADLAMRIERLKKLKQLILNHEEVILEALRLDLGKPRHEAYASEIGFIYQEIDHAVQNLPRWAKNRQYPSPFFLFPSRSRIVREPFGSVLIIAPWNYPFQLVISPLIAALAAGNSAVIKPSEVAGHTQKLVTELINSHFTRDIVYAVGGGIAESQELLRLPFDFIFFTGSPQVGRIVMKAAAENLTPVCLELGGKSPCIVDEDTDMEVTVRRIVWGKFYNAGQTCVAPDYVYVKSAVQAEFLQRVKKQITEFFGADPQASPDYARIINQKHFTRLVALLPEDKGSIACGGDTEKESLYISPTVISGVTWHDPLMQEEIFGPLMPVLTFDRIETVIDEIARQPKPLALCLFSRSKEIRKLVSRRLSFGGGCINDTLVHLSAPHLPFGGVGTSGMGAYHGKYGFDLFSHRKGILERSYSLDLSLRYPPYTDKKWNWLKRLL